MKDDFKVLKFVYASILLIVGAISTIYLHLMITAVVDLYTDFGIEQLPLLTDIIVSTSPLLQIVTFLKFFIFALYFVFSGLKGEFRYKNKIDVLAVILSFLLVAGSIFVAVLLNYPIVNLGQTLN